MKLTGFYEVRAPGEPTMVLTTLGPVDVDELVGRLADRLRELPAGAVARVDVIAWGDEP
jgi:hypothetical protein